MLRKLRSPRFKPRTRKNIFLSVPWRRETWPYRVQRDLSVTPIHETLKVQVNSFFLWWDLILLFRDILNAMQPFTFKSHWADGHSFYSICFRHGGGQQHTAHFLSKCKLWPGVVSYIAFRSTSWNDMYLHPPQKGGKAHLPFFYI